MESIQDEHQPLSLCSGERPRICNEADEDKKKIVIIFHDKSIYNSYEGQTWIRGGGGGFHPSILPKTKGSGS